MPESTPENELKLPPLPQDPLPHLLLTQKGQVAWVPIGSIKAQPQAEDDAGEEWKIVVMPF